MEEIKYKALDKLLYTEDKYTENYRKNLTLNCFENSVDPRFSLTVAAYLEKKLKLKEGNLSLGIAKTQQFDILTLEMDVKENDRVAVSISSMGAIYGLWFKKDDIYVNSSISVGASFRESVVLTGLLIEASRVFKKDNTKLENLYLEIESKINSDEDLSQALSDYTLELRNEAANFVWLNNSGEISYRELYIHSLPYTSLVTDVLVGKENFILFPVK